MSKKKPLSVEKKLRALYDLQLIDSRIDEIKNLRGELPLEVEDLENEISGLNERLDKVQTEIKEDEHEILDHKQTIETAKELLKNMKKNLKMFVIIENTTQLLRNKNFKNLRYN
jgi:hypothetical protein